jgi:hypothetical protein
VSYATARAQIISILEGITPSVKTLFPERFKAVQRIMDGENLTSRSFKLEANVDDDGVIRGPDLVNLSLNPLNVVEMTLTVTYRRVTDEAKLDLTLEGDRRDITIALLKQTNWGQPTSGIESLTRGPPFMPTRRVYEANRVLQVTRFPCMFR